MFGFFLLRRRLLQVELNSYSMAGKADGNPDVPEGDESPRARPSLWTSRLIYIYIYL